MDPTDDEIDKMVWELMHPKSEEAKKAKKAAQEDIEQETTKDVTRKNPNTKS